MKIAKKSPRVNPMKLFIIVSLWRF